MPSPKARALDKLMHGVCRALRCEPQGLGGVAGVGLGGGGSSPCGWSGGRNPSPLPWWRIGVGRQQPPICWSGVWDPSPCHPPAHLEKNFQPASPLPLSPTCEAHFFSLLEGWWWQEWVWVAAAHHVADLGAGLLLFPSSHVPCHFEISKPNTKQIRERKLCQNQLQKPSHRPNTGHNSDKLQNYKEVFAHNEPLLKANLAADPGAGSTPTEPKTI